MTAGPPAVDTRRKDIHTQQLTIQSVDEQTGMYMNTTVSMWLQVKVSLNTPEKENTYITL